MNSDKEQIQLKTLNQLESMVNSRMAKVGIVMDDYDGGQVNAYESVINDINAFRAIIKHTSS